MGIIASKINAQFVVALGDNFYEHGITGDPVKRFNLTFENVYVNPSLMIPWYVIAGNHDHYGDVSTQIKYTDLYANTNHRWNFPSLYHSRSFSSGGVTLDLVLIDTVDLCYSEHLLDTDSFSPPPLLKKEESMSSGKQWKWIEEKLKNSKADYLLVGGHFPVYSICSHGPTPTLVKHLRPLLEKYQAHYLSGHDHCMMHWNEPDSHVNYVLSGMGCDCCYEASNMYNDLNPTDLEESLKWYIADGSDVKDVGDGTFLKVVGGFSSFEANEMALNIRYHDHEGNVLFEAESIPPRDLEKLSSVIHDDSMII